MLISKINFKIILIHFQIKNTFKNNIYYIKKKKNLKLAHLPYTQLDNNLSQIGGGPRHESQESRVRGGAVGGSHCEAQTFPELKACIPDLSTAFCYFFQFVDHVTL
jgi:hypothetical protein